MEQLLGVASALQRRRRSEETAIRLHRMRYDIRIYPHIYVTVPVEALGRPSRTVADRLGCGELNRGGLIDATDPGRLQGGIESLRGGAVRTCRDSSSVRGRTLAGNVRTGATCAMPPRPQLHRTPPRPSAKIQLHSLFPYLSLNLRTDKETVSFF